jgi:replicative DNA helicase
MALYSIQVEKHVLGGLIQNPNIIAEIDRFVSEKDFVAEPHSIIFSCLRQAYLANEKIDKVLLGQRIKNLGIAFKDDINIFDYIDAISFTPVTIPSTIKACQELAKLRALRDIDSTCDEMKNIVGKSINDSLDNTISIIDAVYGKQMNSFEHENEPVLLFDGIYDKVEERGNNPIDEVGLATPYPEFNRLYGGLRRKNLYIIASRAKSGKTTWLNETCAEMSRMHNVPVLILDTEMSTEEIQYRTAAAKSSVGLWHLKTGNWRKNEDSIDKVRTNLAGIKNAYPKVYHMSVGNKSIEHIASICRRWYLKVVGRGNDCLVVYDYLKIIESSDNRRQEYQEMGDRVDFMKKLSEELDCPILTACQNNRDGVAASRDPSEIIDDERSIGISDRITHFASGVWILRRRTPDEMTLDTPESGSHKLIEIVVREQGRDAAGHQDFILRRFPDGKQKYVKNFINFHISNFRVEERGSLRDTIARQNAQFLVQDNPDNHAVEVRQETL